MHQAHSPSTPSPRQPPYAKRLDTTRSELRVFLGYETAWRYAEKEYLYGGRRGFVLEPGQSYDLRVVQGHSILMIALDHVRWAQVLTAARNLLQAGATYVAAISPSGNFRLFRYEELNDYKK